MPDILSKGSLFPAELVPGFIQKTTGASALAKLCGATPIPFNGMKEFTFTLDKDRKASGLVVGQWEAQGVAPFRRQ